MSALAHFRNRVYSVLLTVFRVLPAPIRRGLVRAGTPSYTIGAVCVLMHEGQALFLRQPHRHGWSLPGGLLDRGESPADGVAREVREETGIRIVVGEPAVTDVHPRARRVDVVYVVETNVRPVVKVGGEAQEYAWWPLDQVPEMDSSTHDILDSLLRPAPRPGRVIQ